MALKRKVEDGEGGDERWLITYADLITLLLVLFLILYSIANIDNCLLYTSPSPRDRTRSRMPSSA